MKISDADPEKNDNEKKDDELKLDLNKLRESYEKLLDKGENEFTESSIEDLNFLHTQFCNYATIQLLSMYAHDKFDGKKAANNFLKRVVKEFVNSKCKSLYSYRDRSSTVPK